MGKKIKKDEKGPPDDVLEPLLVESRQAATVVLMLNSPEEDIVAKACEAIYKFVDKADDNKKLLLDLGAVEALLTLIQHEERIIRRNACMALGVMTAHPEVRRCLRKKDESIQCFVNLLNPEEDTVVHEFAALGLASMAAEYSSKVTIYEHNGLEPLIACLASHDPDVQKNSIETINLLLQDYQSKAAIRELGGFPPILDLLKSEYAVIQQLALTALHQASEDCDNRAELRELEAINKLIDFIGHPEWNDLHVYAVMVISNCLEDSESIEMIKDNGGLQKLVAYITDTTPPEDEDPKKGGKKEKAASRAGKKGKDDESARATPKTIDTFMNAVVKSESDTEDPSHPSVGNNPPPTGVTSAAAPPTLGSAGGAAAGGGVAGGGVAAWSSSTIHTTLSHHTHHQHHHPYRYHTRAATCTYVL